MSPSGIEQSGVFTAVWWIVAVMSVIAAILVVHLTDILKAALALVGVFLGVAVFFVMLNAELLAAIQVLIYAGAISILIIFAVLLTRDIQQGNPSNKLRVPALLLVGILLAVLVFVVLNSEWGLLREAKLAQGTQARVAEVYSNSTPGIARLLLRDFVLPFEMVSVVLFAAVVGALALLREP